jgi:hypothetical protein
MTAEEFEKGLNAESIRTTAGKKICLIVSEAFIQFAGGLRAAKENERESLARYIGLKLWAGLPPSRSSLETAAEDVELVRSRLVDGVPISADKG